MSVSVDLIGRLGNQLFQIAACVGYSIKHNVEYNIPAWEYDCFKIKGTFATGTTNYGEKGFCYEDIPFIPDVKLFGYWQSEKYFKHCEEKIRELFQFNDDIQNRMKSKYAEQLNSGITCSIHLRRTDYIGSQLHDVCGLEYYRNAITEIKNRTYVESFLVFSDDIDWCKQNFTAEDFIFIVGNSNVEDLYLQTQCTHNIIANSSFSWFGAWLNGNKDKIVIAPARWFGNESYDTRDIIPEEWIKVKN